MLATALAAAAVAAGSPTCPVTTPNERHGPFTHGSARLWVNVVTTTVRTGTTPVAGAGPGLQPDGTIRVKYPWFGTRRAHGRFRLTAREVGGTATSRTSVSPGEAGESARFWASVVRFRHHGCWRVTGRTRDARVSLVVAILP